MTTAGLRALGLSALLALAACSSPTAEQDANTPDETALSEVDGPSASPRATASTPAPQPSAALPPAGAPRRYVGRWAARADLCEGGAWVFGRDSFGMEDGPMCEFTEVREIPGGYRIAGRCGGPRGERSETTFTLRFAESAQAMLVEGLANLPDAGLVYCGPA